MILCYTSSHRVGNGNDDDDDDDNDDVLINIHLFIIKELKSMSDSQNTEDGDDIVKAAFECIHCGKGYYY